MLLEVALVGSQVRLPGDVQAPLDAPQYGGTLVVLEVMAGIGAQQQEDFIEQRLGLGGVAATGAQGRGRVSSSMVGSLTWRALRHSSMSFCGISATGSTASTMPVSSAARGMLS